MSKKNKYHENDVINSWVVKATNLVIKSVSKIDTLTADEFAELRHEIEATRHMIVAEVLPIVSNEKNLCESLMDQAEAESFVEALQEASSIKVEVTGKRVTASIAESIARRKAKGEDTAYAIAKANYNKAKSDESMIYQLIKSMNGVSNAMSAIIKSTTH